MLNVSCRDGAVWVLELRFENSLFPKVSFLIIAFGNNKIVCLTMANTLAFKIITFVKKNTITFYTFWKVKEIKWVFLSQLLKYNYLGKCW